MKNLVPACALSVLALAPIHPACAGPFDEFSRGGNGDIYAIGKFFTGWDEITSSDNSESLNIDSTFGAGFAITYDVLDNLAVSTELVGAPVTFSAASGGGESEGSLFGWGLSLDFNILRTRLTPLLTASGGILVLNGDASDFSGSFSETGFTYGVGCGLRWDVTDRFQLKAVYQVNWVNLDAGDGSTMFHTLIIALGYRFF